MATSLTLENMATLFKPMLVNSDGGITNAVVVCAAAGTAYGLPHISIPNGRAVILKSHPSNAFGALILIDPSPTNCLRIIGAYPLAVNEAVSYYIADTSVLYVSSTIAGSVLVISVERNR